MKNKLKTASTVILMILITGVFVYGLKTAQEFLYFAQHGEQTACQVHEFAAGVDAMRCADIDKNEYVARLLVSVVVALTCLIFLVHLVSPPEDD